MAGVIPDRDAQLLSAYLDGELSSDELDRVSELLQDEEAIATFRGLQAARTRVHLLPQLEVPMWLLPDGHLGGSLSAYLDGELATAETRRVAAHLSGCAACRGELRDLDGARTAVRALPGVEPPEFIALERAERKTRHLPAKVGALVAGAAAAVVLVGGITSGGAPSPEVDLTDLASLHVARASAQPAFSVFPAIADGSGP